MASVYLAIQESLDRPVALKVLDASFLEDPQFSERFLDEGRIIASLNHRNIITIHDIGIVDSAHYISMEYVEGGDLVRHIAEGVDWEHALDIVEAMGECLHFGHEAGVVHRDVKPANILFRTDGTPLLTDFGIAKRLRATSDLTVAGSVLGTPSYLSPEQAQGKPIDGRADIYALGVILYEMLVGERPYDADTDIAIIFRHLQDPIPKLPRDLKHLQPLLGRMLAKRPKDRFRNAAAMVDFICDLRSRSAPHTMTRPMAIPVSARGPGAERGARRRLPPARLWGAGIWGLSVLALAALSFRLALWPLPNGPSTDSADGSVVSAEPEAAVSPPASDGSAASPDEPTRAAAATSRSVSKPARQRSWREQREKAIQSLLARGDAALEAERLTVPEHDNAYDHYREALRRDPDNAHAERGLRAIARRYEILAEQQIARGNLGAARRYAERGIDVQPLSQDLIRLRAEIDKQIEIRKLLRLAKEALADYRLTTPATRNAYFYYRRVLQMDPNNQRASDGMEAIARRYAALAEGELAQYRYPKAQRYIRLGLKVQPNNKRLLALKEEAQLKNAPKQILKDLKGLFE
ncbi:MAG: protein kinase [Gammaproteobacteria bacterium]|nr:protein kinase [Gammaproteobacteria bacterium]NIR89223.1 protein kinase [Gammaproteobacteria bacterium]